MDFPRRQFFLSLLAYAAQRSIQPKVLCESADVHFQHLMKDQSMDISALQMEKLWINAIHLSNDPLFGLHFGESTQLSALGAVGEIIKSSSTVGEAVKIAASLVPLVSEQFTMEVSASQKSFRLILQRNERACKQYEVSSVQMADWLMVFAVHELDGLLLQKIEPLSVTYPTKISFQDEYQRVFRCKRVRKGTNHMIEFPKKYWDEPIITANYHLQRQFLEKIGTHKRQMLRPSSFRNTVHHYVMNNSFLGTPSLEAVAANFNMTARSVQRKLKEEGTSFQQITDEIRRALAIRYIRLQKHPLKEISEMLGYNEVSAFTRAFKRWTGKPPSAYTSKRKL